MKKISPVVLTITLVSLVGLGAFFYFSQSTTRFQAGECVRDLNSGSEGFVYYIADKQKNNYIVNGWWEGKWGDWKSLTEVQSELVDDFEVADEKYYRFVLIGCPEGVPSNYKIRTISNEQQKISQSQISEYHKLLESGEVKAYEKTQKQKCEEANSNYTLFMQGLEELGKDQNSEEFSDKILNLQEQVEIECSS